MSQQAMDSVTKRVLERLAESPIQHDRVYHEEVRYCWIDEDDQRVSPVHTNFGSALSWAARLPDIIQRRERWTSELAAEIEENGDREDSYFAQTKRKMDEERIAKLDDIISLTGKPPIALQRLVIRTVAEPLAAHEVVTAKAVLANTGLT